METLSSYAEIIITSTAREYIMNKIDLRWYEHLKALSRITTAEKFDKYKTENTRKYGKYMEGNTWNELHQLGYVNFNPHVNNIITPSGLELLRMLEDERRKDITLISSVIAVVISLVALAKSRGWI